MAGNAFAVQTRRRPRARGTILCRYTRYSHRQGPLAAELIRRRPVGPGQWLCVTSNGGPYYLSTAENKTSNVEAEKVWPRGKQELGLNEKKGGLFASERERRHPYYSSVLAPSGTASTIVL
jgi:hypothetical protein